MTTTSIPTTTAPNPDPPPIPALPATASRIAVLRAMLAKELRELAPWATILSIALGVFLVVPLYQAHAVVKSISSYSLADPVFLSYPYIAISAFAAPFAALLLGFVQFFRETSPDRFAFLTHRPASRPLIFVAKSFCGLAIYALAMALPHALALLWASTPSNLPLPFSWSMALVPFSDILSGIPYFFAGTLIARRSEARWYATRLLPLLAPFPLTMLAFLSPNILWSALCSLVAAMILFLPARGAFLAAGQYRSQPRTSKFFLGLVLTISLVLAGGVVIALAREIVFANFGRNARLHGARIDFARDGTPVREDLSDEHKTRFFTLDGQPLAQQYLPKGDLDRAQLAWIVRDYAGLEIFHQPQHFFTYVFTADSTHWFAHAAGDYLVAYDARQRKLVGAIGPRGFEPDRAIPSQRFAEPLLTGGGLVASHDTLFHIDGDNLSPLFHVPEGKPIRQISRFDVPNNRPSNAAFRSFTALLTDDTLFVLEDALKSNLAFTFTHPDLMKGQLTVASLEGGRFLVDFTPFRSPPYNNKSPRTAAIINPDNTIQREFSLPDDIYKWTPEPSFVDLVDQFIAPALTPPLAVVIIAIIGRLTRDQAFTDPAFLHYLWTSTASAAVLCIATILLGRRRYFSRAHWLLWIPLTLLLGAVALLVLLALRAAPVRSRCPICRKSRPVTHSDCPHCRAPWPDPPQTGTEIFA